MNSTILFKPIPIFSAILAAGAQISLSAPSAEEILKATGVRGGLVVHLGCGDGSLAAELGRKDGFMVHALDSDPAKVAAAREDLQEKSLYGKVSVEVLSAESLPYADNLVNLLVVEKGVDISRGEMLRVLVPEGVAYVREGSKWEKVTKPRPEEMGEWTHFLHKPDNNPVAEDGLIGPPDSIQWMATPKFSRAHEQQASFSACVASGGRMIYIMDDSPRVDIRLPAKWMLIARDAFNGVTLWEREMGEWVNQYRRFRSGPASLPFRLVADDDKVFVTFDFKGPVHVLDAATGETIRVIEGSEKAKQVIYEKGILTLLIDEDVDRLEEIDEARRRGEFIPHSCRIMKVHVDSGETVWSREVEELVFPCMAMKNGRVYAQTPTRVFSVDYESGSVAWDNNFKTHIPVSAGKLKNDEMQWESPTLVVDDKVVFVADFEKVHAYRPSDGELIWTGKSTHEYNAPPDVMVVDNLLWMRGKGGRSALDLMTGEVKKEIATQKPYMHPRCYRGKVAGNYLLLGEMGIQMIDLDSGDVRENDWIRGTCQYGIMPANGMLYVPPDACACNMKTKLSGLFAFSSSGIAKKLRPENPLEKGPAFGDFESGGSAVGADEWPTFRATSGRTGVVQTSVPAELKEAWATDIGGTLSSATIAGGQVYVAAVDRHTVHALDAKSGEERWKYTAGGRIDSPPTIFEGGVYFGSADGWVYALRASDGELAWRFRAAPMERRIAIRGQLESSWPVHGSVLIENGTLICSAGRSSYLDGGIRIYRINPATGKMLADTVVYSPDSETGKQPVPTQENRRDVRGLLSDIMLADGGDVYMRQAKLDFSTGDERGSGVHLFSPLGFLDDTWWHRAYWVVHDQFTSHWSGWWKVGNEVASGRILSYSAEEIFGFGRNQYHGGNTGQWRGGEKYQLFAYDRTQPPPEEEFEEVIDRRGKKVKKRKVPEVKYRWTSEVPLLATSLAVTDDTVFIAGPPDLFSAHGEGDELLNLEDAASAMAAWNGEKGGVLYAASTVDGGKLAEVRLESPTVFDGMAAADGRLFLSLKNGTFVCLAGE